jgi:hypothetical protein
VRLGYAQHIHGAQGATVTCTLVVTGGWQTKPAYVEASRARQGTDWFVSREDLGAEGHDSDRIHRLAEWRHQDMEARCATTRVDPKVAANVCGSTARTDRWETESATPGKPPQGVLLSRPEPIAN